MTGAPLVSIFNFSLAIVAQRPIGSPTEDSIMALACMRSWPLVRREVLRECPWGFATVIEELSAISGYTAPQGWFYGYAYPSKCLAMRKIFQPTEPVDTGGAVFLNQPGQSPASPNGLANPIRQTTGDKFREIFDPGTNGKIILSQTQDAVAEYTYDVEDTEIYDATCVTLMGYRLAADIAAPLTGDSNLAVNLIKMYNSRLSEAQRLNSYEDNTRSLGDDLTVNSRG